MKKLLLRKATMISLLLLFVSNLAFTQSLTVTGVVKDAMDNNTLPGVNILVKGTTRGTVSDIDGNYSIAAEPNDVLEFSMIGYIKEEVPVNGQTVINITLSQDITQLDEIVVIGYGTQKKSDLTGSVSVVNTENIQKIASTDIAKVLQGQTSGVQVFGGGEPGAVQQVQIRGVGTFLNSSPLYVIDGVPIAAATNINLSGQSFQFENNAPGFGSDAPAGGINDFNPSDIESVQILKDASAAAIYGARGANGVIIITTKRGKSGAMRVTYDGKYGVQSVLTRLDLCNRQQFQEINNLARSNDGANTSAVNDTMRNGVVDANKVAIYNLYKDIDTDWQEETFTTGHITDHTLSIQGGTEFSNYYGSISYFDQTGTVVGPGPRFTKYSAQLNLDQKKGRIKISESFSYSSSDQIRLTSSRWNNYMIELAQAIPTVPIYDSNNIGGYGGSDNNYLQIAGNPIAFNNLKEANMNRHRFLGVITGELEILKSLSYKINLSYDRSDWYNKEFIPVYQVGNRHTWEYAIYNEWRGENPVMLMEHLLNFNKTAGKHVISAVAGYTAQKDHIQDLYAHAEWPEMYLGPYLKVISGVSSGQTSLGKKYEHTMISYLGRFNYSYADKYLITASVRRDYSSNFGPQNKYGNFPSFAGAWKISNEEFFNITFINNLKLRGGWGKIGNENIGAYLYETNVNNAVTYVFDGQLFDGTTQTVATDPSIKWEERVTSYGGFDLAMLQNKIEISAEYYKNKANDILMAYPVPILSGAVGYEIAAANGASMKNQGIEINISYRKKEGDFHYELSGNLTTLRNEVTKLGTINLPVEETTSRTEVGRSIGELYGHIVEGIFQDTSQINTVAPGNAGYDPNKHAFQHARTEPGDVMFKDLDENGQITVDDRDYIGNTFPKFTYGFNASADYKGIDLSIFISGVYGNKVYNNVYAVISGLGEGNYSVESYENYWRVDRPSTTWPRPTVLDRNDNNRASDRWVQDGSYLRIQNIQLGYTIPKTILGKVQGIDNLRIYVQAQNLLTITKLVGYDPDFVNDGIFNRGYLSGSYPTPTTFLFGVKLGL